MSRKRLIVLLVVFASAVLCNIVVFLYMRRRLAAVRRMEKSFSTIKRSGLQDAPMRFGHNRTRPHRLNRERKGGDEDGVFPH